MQSQSPVSPLCKNNGQAGEGFKVNIRGLGTTGNSDPLYVVDGAAGGSLNDLNPADIESIDVLKDAASAAIYANGVILSPPSRANPASCRYRTTDTTVNNTYMVPDVLNAQEYIYSRQLQRVQRRRSPT